MVSLMAPNADGFYRALSRYLTRRHGIAVEVEETVPWQERERMLDRGEVDLAAICGLPYVLKADRPDPSIALLAAPVMQGARYGGRAIYFSDVIVRSDSPFREFAELRGGIWACNEPGSHSGYALTRYQLARLRRSDGFFARMVEAGAHQVAMRMVARGDVDASAIDSTVLELELARHPGLARRLRVIATFGPSPVPPLVVAARVPAAVRQRLFDALLTMHAHAAGRRVLAEARVARFTQVADADYDPIREMARDGAMVRWTPAALPG